MKITFDDKEQLITNPQIPRKNKVIADDMNEIKRAVNDNDDNINDLDINKADKTEIPTNLNQLSNADTKFVNETQLANAVQTETTARQQQDVELQNQIDAIVASSDVVDIVGTYQELQNYDTSTITENDIIKVLQDSSHDNATSYFRWANNVWGYVGSEGPCYTKGETDERLNQKANQTSLDQTNENLNTLSGRVGTNENDISGIKAEQTTQNRQIATLIADSGNKIELSVNSQTYILTATLKNKAGEILNSSQVDLPLEAMIVNATYDSTTKELVLTLQNGTTLRVSLADIVSGLVSQDDFDDLEDDVAGIKDEQDTQNAEIEELQEQVQILENTVNSELEDATATGESISVIDSANAPAKLLPSGNTYQATNIKTYRCEGTETGDYYFTYDSINYQFTMSTIETGSILAFNTDTLKLYLGETEITTTTDNTGTLITLQDTPNTDYPQTIHVISGNNQIKIQNRNLWNPQKVISDSNDPSIYISSDEKWIRFTTTSHRMKFYPEGLKNATQYSFKAVVKTASSDINRIQITAFYTDGTSNLICDLTTTDTSEHTIQGTTTSGKTLSFLESGYTNGKETFIKIEGTQLEKGTIVTDFVPHQEQTAEFTLEEGQNMYEGDYLADDGIHHVMGEKSYDGSEAGWGENGSGTNTYRFQIGTGSTFLSGQSGYCNSNKFVRSGVSSDTQLAGIVEGILYYRINKNIIDEIEGSTNVAKFRTWLSHNLMTIQTKRATELIEPYTETQQAQYNKLKKILSYFAGTNVNTISAEDLEPILNFDYKKSNRLRIENLENAVFNQ